MQTRSEFYYTVQYADDRLLVPFVSTWVFLGRKLDPEDVDEMLYFQDVDSFQDGVCYGAPDNKDARIHVYRDDEIKFFFEFEKAIEELMKCSLRRRKGSDQRLPNSFHEKP